MALTATELQAVRNYCASRFPTVPYTKPQINAVLTAIDDAMTSRVIAAGDVGQTIPQLISAVIDAASPISFTVPQKKVLFALWADIKFNQDK